jgi:hypothetical protein
MTDLSMRLMQDRVGVVMRGLQQALHEAILEVQAKEKKG